MFTVLGRAVARHPLVIVAGWMVVGVGIRLLAPGSHTFAAREPASLLPPDQPYNRALKVAESAFPTTARTQTVLIVERPTGLTDADHRYLAEVARRLSDHGHPWRVLSGETQPFLRSRLRSADGQAAMIIVNQNLNYLTRPCIAQVNEIEALAREGLPAGLSLEVTGEGGLGRDLAKSTAEAYHRTTWVTIGAVLIILLLVYRAPLAALVPLISIGTSVYVALRLLDALAALGWAVSDVERTFTVVLLFGSGTDFAMLWIARYREALAADRDAITAGIALREQRVQSATTATVTTAPAVIASAATTIAGLTMLLFADLSPTHEAGRVLGIALAVSLLAALTLTPAVARLMGDAFFWPRRLASRDSGRKGVWCRVAHVVVRRPRAVLLVAALVLAGPIWVGGHVKYRYDAFGVIPPDSSSARGRAIAERHFTADELFSWTFVVEVPPARVTGATLDKLARELGARCAALPGVTDVWSIDAPLGRRGGRGLSGVLGKSVAAGYYVSRNPPCIRAEVMQAKPPFSEEAMTRCARLQERLRTWARSCIGPDAHVHAIGLTPYILNVRSVSQYDQRRVMVMVVAAVAVIMVIWLRRLILAACMVGATLALYLATLGVASVVFSRWLGGPALDWKVNLFLFVVMMAVGQDYNIFLVSRLLQERRAHDARGATVAAISSTGKIISSCGLIMAATLGSIAATGLSFYQQLGFALAFGILLDTFVIRPAVVPACYLLRETVRARRLDARQSEPYSTGRL
jgi:RND superfamily putative drug exporter